MKHLIPIILLISGMSTAFADEAITVASVAPAASAAQGPSEAASAVEAPAAAEVAPQDGVHAGQIASIAGCGETNHVALKTFTAARAVVAGIGGWFFNFVPTPKVRYDQRCVVVSFPDGTADQTATFESKDFEQRHLSVNQAVTVRFDGGKPEFTWQ